MDWNRRTKSIFVSELLSRFVSPQRTQTEDSCLSVSPWRATHHPLRAPIAASGPNWPSSPGPIASENETRDRGHWACYPSRVFAARRASDPPQATTLAANTKTMSESRGVGVVKANRLASAWPKFELFTNELACYSGDSSGQLSARARSANTLGGGSSCSR